MDFVQQFVVVILVLAILGALVLVARNRGIANFPLPNRQSRPRRMEAIERLALTPNHSLHLVIVDGRKILVGVSPSSCQLLEERQ
jgi:flagellar biogenesis protein FliO